MSNPFDGFRISPITSEISTFRDVLLNGETVEETFFSVEKVLVEPWKGGKTYTAIRCTAGGEITYTLNNKELDIAQDTMEEYLWRS